MRNQKNESAGQIIVCFPSLGHGRQSILNSRYGMDDRMTYIYIHTYIYICTTISMISYVHSTDVSGFVASLSVDCQR